MRRWFRRAIVATAVVLLAMQLYRPARTNPPVDPRQTIHSLAAVDPAVTAVMDRACTDCHSNLTTWPWYSGVAPVSWLVVSDVNRGRAALNFSEWSRYEPSAQAKHLKEICSEVSEGEMPATQYLLMHPRAKLAASEKDAVCRWTKTVARGRAATIAD